MRLNSRNIFSTTLLATMLVSGCASGPTRFDIKTSGDPVINRDISGKPLSVVVRLYQLKDANEFSKLTFATAASGRSDAELFGQEFIERTEVVVVPGAQKVNAGTILPETKYLGVVGYFRNPDRHAWRYLVKADDVRRHGLTFTVRDCYLELSGIKPVAIPSQPEGAKAECNDPDNQPSANGRPAAANKAAPPVKQKAKRPSAKPLPLPTTPQ